MKFVDRLLIGKDGILMSDMMTFPDTWEEFEKLYGFNDAEEIYTNNSRLIPSFRVKQWLDHLPSVQPKERCIANITVSKEDLEKIVKEQAEEIKEMLPRKGKWTRHFDGNEWYWYCSSCKESWYEEDLWMGGNSFPNFCPNCGSYNGGEKTNCGCCMEEGDAE